MYGHAVECNSYATDMIKLQAFMRGKLMQTR